MATNYAKHVAKKNTPITEPLLGEDQIANHIGGFAYKLDPWKILDRFLILGGEGGTYYVGERKLTQENAQNIVNLIKLEGVRVVARVVEISDSGRAPKNDPAIFALALCTAFGNEATKRAAFDNLSKVCRIGTHLFHFLEYMNSLRGWGRMAKRAVGKWYTERRATSLALQLFKYKSRDGWSHRDALRLCKVKPADSTIDALLGHAVGKPKPIEDVAVRNWVGAVLELANCKDPARAAALIDAHELPREVVPTELLNEAVVWEALLPSMPPHALIRNLATLTRAGLLAPLSSANKVVLSKLSDFDALCKARVHPIAVLSALKTYAQGHGELGKHTWTPVQQVLDILEEAFYGTFKGVQPCGKGVLLALDVSGSMGGGEIAGVRGLTPAMATAALSLVTARTEPNYHIMGFADTFKDLRITAKTDLSSAMDKVVQQNFGSTNCALAIEWALKNKVKCELFVIYTDNESNRGPHPSAMLREYRKKMGIDAKLVVVGMTATEVSIADPNDAGMMDVVGFDASCPQIISDFGAGR